jgi:hypothetical protein
MIPFLPLSAAWKSYSQPATVYSAVAGFIVNWVLAKAGSESKAVVTATMANVS